MSKQYRLPDGTHTQDAEEYLYSWHKEVDPLAKEMGWIVLGFNPGAIYDTGYGTIDLKLPVIKQLTERIKRSNSCVNTNFKRMMSGTRTN